MTLSLVHDARRSSDTQMPPLDHGAECAVLSAAMLDPSALPKLLALLKPEDFGGAAHRRIYRALVDLYLAKTPIDATTVASALLARGELASVGGAGYIAEVLDGSPAVANVIAHATAVHDVARRRRMIFACQQIAAEGYLGVNDVQTWCERSTKALAAIAHANPFRPIETNEQALTRILTEALADDVAADPSATRLTGYPMGIYGLDRLLGGLRRKAKTTVAATTGAGKTAFAVQVAIALARQGVGVLFFSLELERTELLRRAIACESGVSANRVKQRRLSPTDKQRIVETTERLKVLPWRVDESPRLTIEQIAAASKAMQEEMALVHRVPLGMIVLDYVQRLDPSPVVARRERHEQIGHATKNFKILCQELDVVGLELAQSKDGIPGKKREDPRITTGIADSSQVAKESDDVIFLVAEPPVPNDPRVAVTAHVAKNRAGAKGKVDLMFRGDIFRFADPNAPEPNRNPSRQYVDDSPPSDASPLTEGLL